MHDSKSPEECDQLHGSGQPESALEQAASVFDLTYDPSSSPPQRGKQSNVTPQGLESILACLSAASFHIPVGVVVGFSAILIPQLQKKDSEIVIDSESQGWIASMAVLVVLMMAPIAGMLVDWMGRLNTIKIAALPYTIGWVLIATTDGLPLLLLGRFLTGFALALGPSPSIVYITEVARPDLRGSLICTGPSMTSLGMLLIYVKGWFLHWRTVAWLSIIYCLLPLILMFIWSPESPVWLLSKGKTEKALHSLKFLSRYETSGGSAERQLAAMQKEFENKGTTLTKTSMLTRLYRGMRKPTGYKPFLILVMMFFFQQFSGCYICLFYAVNFFKDVGANIDSYVCAILIGLIRLLVGLLTSGLLKRYGRRPLCALSGLGMAVSLFISGFFTNEIHKGHTEYGWVPVACMLVYMSLSVIGLLSIPWTMTAELFPLEIRGLAQGITISLAHMVMFGALVAYPYMPSILGGSHVVHYLFGAVSFISVLFVIVFLPETHKKTLSDIQGYFESNTVYLVRNKERPSQPDAV